MAKKSGLYSMGEFADTPVIMELPELVELATELMNGNRPQLVEKFRKSGVRGQFLPRGSGSIKILKALGADVHQALKTIAHEIGHLVDYKDEGTMARGNILGRIASLKGYLKHYMEEKPGAPGPLTKEDKNRLMKEARMLLKADAAELIDEVIRKEIPVTPDEVLAILKGMEIDPEPSAEVTHFIFTASTSVKKSIALQAMKGLSPKEMAHLKTYIEEKTGNQIAKEDPTGKDIYAKFKELVKEEIAKRNLLSKQVITEELKLFTQLWKPFNVWGDAGYTKYRFKSEELYADALSGILTNPMMVQRVAPTFYKGFFDWIDQKPEASKVWGDISERIGRGPETVSRERVASDYDMLRRGEEVRAEMAKPEPIRGFMDTARIWLDDKNHFINKALKEIEKGNPAHKQAAIDARKQLKELPYIPSEVDAYLYEVNDKIQKVMDDNKITVHDLDVIALRKHIVANRKDIFSTKGYTAETAAADLKVIEKDWGKDKYNKANEILDTLREIRNKRIYPLMEESGLYSEELIKLMNETTDYTKVSVTHWLNKKFGEGAGGRIFQALGTLSDINSPVTATIIQDISIIRAARINQSKRSVIPLLSEAGSAIPAKMTHDGKRRIAVEPEDRDQRLFTVMINGQAENFYVHKYIADSYTYNPYEANAVARTWNFFASFVRQTLITKNVVWMAKNPFRDFRETIKKNPEIKLRHAPRLLMEYKRAVREAYAEAWKKRRSDAVDALMTNRALSEDRIYDGRDYSMDTELQRLENSFKLSTAADKKSNGFRRAWESLNSNLDNFGRANEILSKIAGYKYLKKYTNLSDEEIFHRVRDGAIGTPNWKLRGSFHALTNSIAMFSTIGKEGLKSHYSSFRSNKGAYIWKTIATNFIPKLILLGALKGWYDDKDKDEEDKVGFIERIASGIPEYSISHYTCLPLGLTDDGKSIWLQIPEDYEGQTFGAIFWKTINMELTGTGSAFSEINNLNPYSASPLIVVGRNLWDIYISGINPVDDYRGRKKISDNSFDVGGLPLLKEVGKNAWRDLGGSSLYNPKYDNIDRDRSGYEIALKTWPLNAIGAFIQISDRGVSEKIFDQFRELDLEKTKESIAIDEKLAEMDDEEKRVLASISPRLRDRIEKQLLKSKNTAFSNAYASANTPEKRAIVLRAIIKDYRDKD